jgi:ferredoxin-type protein NapG
MPRQATALPPLAIRPPGALSEADFLGACIRCGLCVRDCPYDILSLASRKSRWPPARPTSSRGRLPCEMCEDIPCVKACPTGALDHSLTDINKAKMGLAVLVDQENCLNFLGMRCDICYRVCPVIDKAITLEQQTNARTGKHALFIPTVHSDACTGCGKCEKACPLEVAAIKVYPTRTGQGRAGQALPLGWVEKEKAGGSLVAPDVEHRYNLPEGMRYESARAVHCEPRRGAASGRPRHGACRPARAPKACKGASAVSVLNKTIGRDAVAAKGWLARTSGCSLRRVSQLGILRPVPGRPLAGVWIVKGNLSYSYTLGVLPLTDPFVLLQSLLTRHLPETKAFVGAAIVLAFYLDRGRARLLLPGSAR